MGLCLVDDCHDSSPFILAVVYLLKAVAVIPLPFPLCSIGSPQLARSGCLRFQMLSIDAREEQGPTGAQREASELHHGGVQLGAKSQAGATGQEQVQNVLHISFLSVCLNCFPFLCV